VFVRLTEEEWFELFCSIEYKDILHLSTEDLNKTEIEEFGIQIYCFEANLNVFSILDRGKFITACIRAGISPKIIEEWTCTHYSR
jgi:hypothetical protein